MNYDLWASLDLFFNAKIPGYKNIFFQSRLNKNSQIPIFILSKKNSFLKAPLYVH